MMYLTAFTLVTLLPILTSDSNINLAIEYKCPYVQQLTNIIIEHNLYPSADKITRYNYFNPENSSTFRVATLPLIALTLFL